MIYQLLKPLIRLSLLIFYRRIDVIGKDNLVLEGPAIYIANHPNALIDPLVAGVIIPRKVFFLAGSNFFGDRIRMYLYKEHLNMIPVYRPWLAKGEKVSNDETFHECYKALYAGKCIILFPEASSKTVSKIREVKSGAIRIKYGAEQFADNTIEVPIIPIGINYSNPHEFQSRILVNIGQPIPLKPGGFKDADDLKRMTALMKAGLEKAIVHIENDEDQDLVRLVNRLYVDNLRSEEGVSHKDVEANFTYLTQIANAVAYFEKNDPEHALDLSSRINLYFSTLRNEKLSDDVVSQSDKIKPGLIKILISILGFPVALTSLIIHFVPYQLTAWLFRAKLAQLIRDDDEEAMFDSAFTSTLIYGSGLVMFQVWNLIVAVIIGLLFSNVVIAVATFFLLFPLLRFSMQYLKISLYNLRYLRNKWASSQNKERIKELRKERDAIIAELTVLHEKYKAIP